jgi:hypothetical protein
MILMNQKEKEEALKESKVLKGNSSQIDLRKWGVEEEGVPSARRRRWVDVLKVTAHERGRFVNIHLYLLSVTSTSSYP